MMLKKNREMSPDVAPKLVQSVSPFVKRGRYIGGFYRNQSRNIIFYKRRAKISNEVSRFLLCITLLFTSLLGFSVKQALGENTEYEEIFVTVRVQGVGATELAPLYVYDSGQLLLPVIDIFQFLRLKVEPSVSLDTLSGFIVDEEKQYLIDNRNKQILADGKTWPLDMTDLIKTETGLFLDHKLFGPLFGLYCTFSFRSLSVEIKPDFEVTAIREIRLRQFRKNVDQLKGEVEVDTTLDREYHLFRFGVADWAVHSTQSKKQPNDTRITISTGAELFGGETNLTLNYSTRDGFHERNQQYYWRWANNRTKIVKQIRLGKISPFSISSVYDPVAGITATNAPTTYRRSFGEYTISDHTEPGWTVELYVNNVIVDYQTADASGFYSFNVPLVYGTSQVMLKFYGPYGEERIKEHFLNIPFNFLPTGEMEYTLSSGLVMDGENSVFGRADVKYGLNRFVTIGGGMEYLSSISKGKKIPLLTASITPFRNFLVTGEYAKGVRSKVLVNYRLASGPILEIDYTRYVKEQQAIRLNYLEERKATLSVPLRLPFLSGYTRWSFRQNVYEMLAYNTADVTLSAFLGRVNANISAYANWLENSEPFMYGNIGLGFRLGHGFTVRPQGQVDITNREIISVKAELEKRISSSGYLSVSGEENFRSSYHSLNFSFRWDFPFTQVDFSARVSGDDFSSTQGAQGSLAFGSGNGHIHKDNRSTTGRGGIAIVPFVDLNHNSSREKGEPYASGVTVRMSGGRVLQGINDSIIRITGLEPYNSYVLTLDDKGLEQIAWRITHKNIRVYIDPNQFKKINIPVLPMGEANGWVFIKDDNGTGGQGRIVVNFFTGKSKRVASTMTERDGGFTWLGLPPGRYYAQVDTNQMKKLNMTSTPAHLYFEIEPSANGDIVTDLEFVIERLE